MSQVTIYQLVAKTLYGLEDVLADELTELGFDHVKPMRRAVSFTGDLSTIYKANYQSRLSLRILWNIKTFRFRSEEDFYQQIYKIDWDEYFSADKSFAIQESVYHSIFKHTKFAAYRAKDAIVDYFRDTQDARPQIDRERPEVTIDLHISGNECNISLDSSGAPLYRRGYKRQADKAPINEVLAAGMIKLAGWSPEIPLLDPMCGSGTILCEAGMLANNVPAGYFRKYFSFKAWNNFDVKLWESIVQEADKKITDTPKTIVGLDRSFRALSIAKSNLQMAGLANQVKTLKITFEKFNPDFENGMIITNPPYGERLELDDAKALYKGIGNVLKNKYSGFTCWIISANFQALKFVELKPKRKIMLFNGPLECRYNEYEMFSGKRSDHLKKD